MLESFGVLNVFAYAAGALALVLVPGPNTLCVFRTSAQHGSAAAFKAASAVFLGDALLIFCAYIGIAGILQAHPALFTAVRFAGAAYLAYLGVSAIISAWKKKKAEGAGEPVKTSARHPFRTALILSLTNPKAILFYVSFFVQFIDPAYPRAWVPYLILASILEAFSALWLTCLSLAGERIFSFAGKSPALRKAGNTAVGTLFLGFAGKLASL